MQQHNNRLDRVTGSVLLIEPNEINQLILVNLLEQHGLSVTIAIHGTTALGLLNTREWSIVLINIHTQGMNGFEITESIRSQEPYQYLPIIALIDDIDQEQTALCYEAGMNDVISLPIEANLFFLKISKWFIKPFYTDEFAYPVDRTYPMTNTLDIQQALYRLNGKIHTYKALLLQFRGESRDMIARINSDINNKDFPAARRLIHILRGASSSLSANQIYLSASRLEEVFAIQGSVDEQALLELNQQINELDIFLNSFLTY